MKTLYPEIEPYNSFQLPVDSRHTLYVEECGNPLGKPVVFLHGGPGGGLTPSYRRYFNPTKYRVILFDQRGCGQSTPFAELADNDTWKLVSDIEAIRQHLSLDRWSVFGGSWGSTLALAYAVTHPDRCLDLFLRGIFLLRKKEIDWFYQEGCSKLFPDLWESYVAEIPLEERGDFVKAYHKRLTGSDPRQRASAGKAWSVWEGSTSKLLYDAESAKKFGEDQFADAFARIECHYFINKGFFPSDNFLLESAPILKDKRIVIVQGRYDVVCPAESAWDLHRTLPNSELHFIANAGHSLSEEGITSKLVEYTDLWA